MVPKGVAIFLSRISWTGGYVWAVCDAFIISLVLVRPGVHTLLQCFGVCSVSKALGAPGAVPAPSPQGQPWHLVRHGWTWKWIWKHFCVGRCSGMSGNWAGPVVFQVKNRIPGHRLQSWARIPFAALQGVCLRCVPGSCTKSPDFPMTEMENWKNLHKGSFRIYIFLSAMFEEFCQHPVFLLHTRGCTVNVAVKESLLCYNFSINSIYSSQSKDAQT